LTVYQSGLSEVLRLVGELRNFDEHPCTLAIEDRRS